MIQLIKYVQLLDLVNVLKNFHCSDLLFSSGALLLCMYCSYSYLFIFMQGEQRERDTGHYKIGTDFYNRLILHDKDLLRVSLGFRCVPDRPDVPSDGLDLCLRFVLKRTEINSERSLERRNTWVYPFGTKLIPHFWLWITCWYYNNI